MVRRMGIKARHRLEGPYRLGDRLLGKEKTAFPIRDVNITSGIPEWGLKLRGNRYFLIFWIVANPCVRVTGENHRFSLTFSGSHLRLFLNCNCNWVFGRAPFPAAPSLTPGSPLVLRT
jgi:hypothetical protein